MASTNRIKTRESKTGDIIAYSELAIRNNASAVEYCRTSMAALSGSTAGNNFIQNFSFLIMSIHSSHFEKCFRQLIRTIFFCF